MDPWRPHCWLRGRLALAGLCLAAVGTQGVTSRWALSLSGSQKPKPANELVTGGPGAWWPEGGKSGEPGPQEGVEKQGRGSGDPSVGGLPLKRLVSRCTQSQGENAPSSEPQAPSSPHLAGVGSAPGLSLAGHALCAPLTATQAAERWASILPTQGPLLPSHASGPTPSMRASRDPGLGDTEGRTWLGARQPEELGARLRGGRGRQGRRPRRCAPARPAPSTALLDTSIRCAPRAAGGEAEFTW